MKRSLTVRRAARILMNNVDHEDAQEILQDISELSYDLSKEEGTFQKELSEELKERIEECVNYLNLCPDCYADVEVKLIRKNGHLTDETERICTAECGWHE